MTVQPHEIRAAVGEAELGLPSQCGQEEVDVADHDPPTRPDNPGEFGDGGAQIGKMDEARGAEGGVGRSVGQRQGGEVAFLEADSGEFGAGAAGMSRARRRRR